MARFANVHVYPYSGWHDISWGTGRGQVETERDRDVDAFARLSRRITEGMSQKLPALDLSAKHASLRIVLNEPADGCGDVEVDFDSRFSEFANAALPAGFRHLRVADQEVTIGRTMLLALELAGANAGWDLARIRQAYAELVAERFQCEWKGLWKLSRDRKRRVRLAARIADDGYGRGRFEVARADHDDILHTSEEYVGWTWVENFKASAKSMRWDTPTRVVIDDSRFIGSRRIWFDAAANILEREVPDQSPRKVERDPALAPAVPDVVREPPRQRILLGGGGPIDSVSRPHNEAADLLLEPVRSSPEWLRWWAATGLDEIDCGFSYWGEKSKITVRVAKNRLAASVFRPSQDLPTPSEAERVARADIEAFLERVRSRFGLPQHPPLRQPGD